MPFDSGAYAKKLYPSYIQNIPRDNFECDVKDAPRRIVSAFFGSFSDYVSGQAKTRADLSDEFSLGPMDAEILSINTLANDPSVSASDDRRFSIEVQIENAVLFDETPPSAVILPTPYLKEKLISDALTDWGAQPINYDVFGLSLASYFGQIFMKFTDYCKSISVK